MKRRTFLKSSLAAGASTLILPSRMWAGPSKNDTLQLGVIGTGRMGLGDMGSAMSLGMRPEVNARVVAVCDVDSNRAAAAKARVEKFYQNEGESDIDVKAYGDFRELLARDDIDGVIISTSEHWHALIAIAAANAGKHMHIQKPLTYSIPEGQALIKAVRRNKVVLQTGSQQRSSTRFRQVCTIIRNNWLGKLKEMDVRVMKDHGTASAEPMPVPPNLDYEMWLGPIEEVPYTEARVHPQSGYSRPGWLQVQRTCLGMITGWGSHMYDTAQWAIGMDDSGPVEVNCVGEFPDRGLWDVHVGYEGEAFYENGVRMISSAGAPGVRFTTEDGWAYVTRGKMECSDPTLLRRKPTDDEISLYESRNQMEDFLLSARAGKDPICPVEIGHRSNTICVLHHISMKLDGRKIKWDPVKEEIVGDNEAAAMIDVPMRSPWTI